MDVAPLPSIDDRKNSSKKTQLAANTEFRSSEILFSSKMIPWNFFDLDDGPKHAIQGYVTSPSPKISPSIQTLDNAGVGRRITSWMQNKR